MTFQKVIVKKRKVEKFFQDITVANRKIDGTFQKIADDLQNDFTLTLEDKIEVMDALQTKVSTEMVLFDDDDGNVPKGTGIKAYTDYIKHIKQTIKSEK